MYTLQTLRNPEWVSLQLIITLIDLILFLSQTGVFAQTFSNIMTNPHHSRSNLLKLLFFPCQAAKNPQCSIMWWQQTGEGNALCHMFACVRWRREVRGYQGEMVMGGGMTCNNISPLDPKQRWWDCMARIINPKPAEAEPYNAMLTNNCILKCSDCKFDSSGEHKTQPPFFLFNQCSLFSIC